MNVQFVRLDNDVIDPVNQMALERRQTVSDLVNEVIREYLEQLQGPHAQSTKSG